MQIISRILFFTSHHGAWTFIILLLTGFAFLSRMKRKGVWVLALCFVLALGNVLAGQFLNAWFLNAFGTRGSAIITEDRQTNSTLNNQFIHDYDVLVKTADGKDVISGFSTTSAAIYPVENAIRIPSTGSFFPVKYIPGFEKNIVILSNESEEGIRRNAYERLRPVQKARILYEASPDNPQFRQQYIEAIQTFINGSTPNDSTLVKEYKATLQQLQQ